ncbi:CBS domain-containing protein [Leptolyngbyaceae cyanobacterium JSC-12]|nr:CBS domain-containing protein [Leptolyngbyaceae cyanobacterium JSC-12]
MMTSPLIFTIPHGVFVAQTSRMLEPSHPGIKLLLVFLLIAINAFFVAAEFSIVSVRRSRINQLVSAGDIQARTVQDLQRSLDRLLSTTQLGITLSSLALGWISESAMVSLVADWLTYSPLPTSMTLGLAHSLAIPITFVAIAYLQIVLGELCPKSVALLYPEELARILGAPSLAIARIFNPFIWILNQSTQLLLRLVGIQYTGQGWYNQVTPEELQLIITTSSESTGLEAEERELLRNVFEFGEVTTGEVMVPRTSIAAIPSDATLKMVLEEVAESGHSRYPVIGESLDDIRGIIQFKELAEPIANDTRLHQTIEQWIRPTRFVPEYMPLNELLVLMQRSHQPMVMVVDEFGGTAGLVTIEDVVAEILGDTIEPDSTEEPPIQILDPQTFLVQAQINLEELNETLNLGLPLTDAYQTLGGFVLFHLQRIPEAGEILHYNGYEFTVTSTEGPRLNQIRIHRLETPTDESTESSSLSDLVQPSPENGSPPPFAEDDAMLE